MIIDFEMDDDNEYTIKSNLEINSKPSNPVYYKEKDCSAYNENPKDKLQILTVDEVRRAFRKQLHYKWTFYDERKFIENLLSNRFNFLLVAYSFFLISMVTLYNCDLTCLANNPKDAFTIKMKLIMRISVLGFFVIGMIFISIAKIYYKLITILKILYKLGDYHVFPLVEKEVKYYTNLGNVNILIGLIIPFILTASFFFIFEYIFINYYSDFFKNPVTMIFMIIIASILFLISLFHVIKN